MCEKAEEIQTLWEERAGDLYAYWGLVDGESNIGLVCGAGALGVTKLGMGCYEDEDGGTGEPVICVAEFTQDDNIWLPRQDQLQEMAKDKFPELKEIVYRFSLWSIFYTSQYTTMEQLWLAFLLAEKYGKVWDGSDWVLKE